MTGVQIVAAGPAPLAAKSLIAKRIEKHVRYGSMLLKKSAARAECATIESSANYWFLESKLPCGTLKIFFQQHRSKAEVLITSQ
jgi:hypothetical protein